MVSCFTRLHYQKNLTDTSYEDDAGYLVVVFPFHACCLEILVWFLTGSTDVHTLNKDALYKALRDIVRSHSGLHFDYGFGDDGHPQYWECNPGEEVNDPSSLCLLAMDIDTPFSSLPWRIPCLSLDSLSS